MSGRQAMP